MRLEKKYLIADSLVILFSIRDPSLEEAELAAGSGPVAGGSYGRRRPGL